MSLNFNLSSTWAVPFADHSALDGLWQASVELKPSSMSVASRCEVLLSARADVELAGSAGTVRVTMASAEASFGDTSTATLIVNGGQETVPFERAGTEFVASFDAHPRSVATVRIRFTNIQQPLCLGPLDVQLRQSARDVKRKQMWATLPAAPPAHPAADEPAPVHAPAPVPGPVPAVSSAEPSAVVTQADLVAMEARLKAHIDQRIDELFARAAQLLTQL
jgi:hypothetical protein